MVSGTWYLERCFLHGWIPVFTVQGRWQTACITMCGWAVCWSQRCGSSGVMVWAGVSYGQRTQVHFIDGILNAQSPEWSPPRVQTEECKDHQLYRATPPGRDTGKGYKFCFLFILFPTICFISVLFFITNSYYVKNKYTKAFTVMLESLLYSYLFLI